jgi:hypothetical protein
MIVIPFEEFARRRKEWEAELRRRRLSDALRDWYNRCPSR